MATVSFFRDPGRRPGAALLDAWPTVTAAPGAVGGGYDVTVLHAAWADETLERDGVVCRFVADPAGIRLPLRLTAAVRALRPHLVHVHGWRFPLQTGLLARLVDAPVLVQDHSGALRTGWHRAFSALAHRAIAAAAFTAAEQAGRFHAMGLLSPRTPVYELLEASTSFTPGDVAAARAEAGVDGDPCIAWIARLNDKKDPLTVLRALALAREALPGARLWMAYGEADLEPEVRAFLAADPALAERVVLLGRIPPARVQALCRAADLFVCGSRSESTMYALLETLASGCTPAVTDIPALRRMTRGGAVGALFPPGDAEALAAALVRLAARDRPAARAAARAHFEAHLSWPAVGREMRAAYDDMLGGPCASA